MPPHAYIDIHKHGHVFSSPEDTLTIMNIYDDFYNVSIESQYSMGIHPWYIHDLSKQYEALQIAARQQNVIAIGECGLDYLRGGSKDLQGTAFEMQIRLANALNKPLILHCVKAFPETFSLLKQANVPVIFHGFNKRLSFAEEALQRGYYLSFGDALLNESFAAYQIFSAIPIDRVFFETDDKDIDIKEIYKAAALIQKTPIETIILQVQENFKKVFNL